MADAGFALIPPIPFTDVCLPCGFHFRTVSRRAIDDAIAEHVHYVNTQLDKTSDVHFEEVRLNRLMLDERPIR